MRQRATFGRVLGYHKQMRSAVLILVLFALPFRLWAGALMLVAHEHSATMVYAHVSLVHAGAHLGQPLPSASYTNLNGPAEYAQAPSSSPACSEHLPLTGDLSLPSSLGLSDPVCTVCDLCHSPVHILATSNFLLPLPPAVWVAPLVISRTGVDLAGLQKPPQG